MSYVPETIVEGDPTHLVEQVNRELRRIQDAFSLVNDLQSSFAVAKPASGMFRWFDGQTHDPGSGEGLYVFTSTGWQLLLPADVALSIFGVAQYGGMYMSSPTLFPSLGLTYEPVTVFDTLAVSVHRGVVPSLTNNSLSLTYDGIYFSSVSGALAHNEQNQGRETFLRFYNITQGAPASRAKLLPTGRNTPGTPVEWNFMFEILETGKGDEFRLEIGGGDSYSAVEWDTLEWSIYSVGEWREPITSDPVG